MADLERGGMPPGRSTPITDRRRITKAERRSARPKPLAPSTYDLTDEERRAIRSLQRLAKRWPQTLMLFSWSGSLVVVPSDGSFAAADDPESLVLDTIAGIPNDGGDP